jgi:hypothetical protein
MIADRKPYAEYKESRSKWLSAGSAKWAVRTLRTLISKRACAPLGGTLVINQ